MLRISRYTTDVLLRFIFVLQVMDLTGGRNSSSKNDNGDQLPNHKQIRESMFKNLLHVNDGNFCFQVCFLRIKEKI